eukprot:TRINITY_DN75402_c0_g1_i1.p1 TRINITY_DN75402_c0_g1~~TRINITY_DN75402_c0_g1_i1.p1  ORF type:complete len:177 (-),score=8.98 TRINITY_DN75402_c0_g1_i1:36-515(-)
MPDLLALYGRAEDWESITRLVKLHKQHKQEVTLAHLHPLNKLFSPKTAAPRRGQRNHFFKPTTVLARPTSPLWTCIYSLVAWLAPWVGKEPTRRSKQATFATIACVTSTGGLWQDLDYFVNFQVGLLWSPEEVAAQAAAEDYAEDLEEFQPDAIPGGFM